MIEKKLVDGLEVTINTNRGLTIVTLSDNKVTQLKRFLAEHDAAVVLISPTGTYIDEFGLTFNVDDFEVLKDLEEIKRVILSNSYKLKSYTGLYYLKNLLELSAWFGSFIELDFSHFKQLEILEYNWTPKTQGLFGCTSLKSIKLWKYKSTQGNLTEFALLPQLTTLQIIQSNISSIKGIETLKLQTCMFAYNPKLDISYDELGFTMPHVEELDIENCKLMDLGFIKVFPNVKRLRLVKFKPIKELRPILDGLPLLEELFVGETLIEETDNRYYLDYSNIKHFFFAEKRHHMLKNKDVDRSPDVYGRW